LSLGVGKDIKPEKHLTGHKIFIQEHLNRLLNDDEYGLLTSGVEEDWNGRQTSDQ